MRGTINLVNFGDLVGPLMPNSKQVENIRQVSRVTLMLHASFSQRGLCVVQTVNKKM